MGFFRSRTQQYSSSPTLEDVLCLDYLGPHVTKSTLTVLLTEAGIRALQVSAQVACTVTAVRRQLEW